MYPLAGYKNTAGSWTQKIKRLCALCRLPDEPQCRKLPQLPLLLLEPLCSWRQRLNLNWESFKGLRLEINLLLYINIYTIPHLALLENWNWIGNDSQALFSALGTYFQLVPIIMSKKLLSKGKWYASTCVTPGVTARGHSIGKITV